MSFAPGSLFRIHVNLDNVVEGKDYVVIDSWADQFDGIFYVTFWDDTWMVRRINSEYCSDNSHKEATAS